MINADGTKNVTTVSTFFFQLKCMQLNLERTFSSHFWYITFYIYVKKISFFQWINSETTEPIYWLYHNENDKFERSNSKELLCEITVVDVICSNWIKMPIFETFSDINSGIYYTISLILSKEGLGGSEGWQKR